MTPTPTTAAQNPTITRSLRLFVLSYASMSDMSPNEIVYTWESEGHLLHDLRIMILLGDDRIPLSRTVEPGPLLKKWTTSVGEDRIEGSNVIKLIQSINFSFIDANGDSLEFPIRLVSATTFDEAPIPSEIYNDLFGLEVRPSDRPKEQA